jgi:hypothetical protein
MSVLVLQLVSRVEVGLVAFLERRSARLDGVVGMNHAVVGVWDHIVAAKLWGIHIPHRSRKEQEGTSNRPALINNPRKDRLNWIAHKALSHVVAVIVNPSIFKPGKKSSRKSSRSSRR